MRLPSAAGIPITSPCASASDLLPPGPADTDAPLVVLAAAKLGTTRLIDNLEI